MSIVLIVTFPAVEEKVKLITKIRESLETVYGAEYGLFLKEYVPIFINLLKTVPKQTVDNVEHKLRNAVLEVCDVMLRNIYSFELSIVTIETFES